jgi:hypothetical protein
MWQTFVGGAVVVLAFISYVPYFRDVLKKRTRPHVFSWLAWTVTMVIASVAQISDGAGPGAWATVASAILDAVILVLALRFGDFDITRLDWVSLAGCALAGVAWALTNDALTAVVLICLVDLFAYMPTMRKSWNKPHEETLSNYALAVVKHGLSMTALLNFSLVTVLYPAVLVLLNVLISIELWGRRRLLHLHPGSHPASVAQ